jgi:hypothetical protein
MQTSLDAGLTAADVLAFLAAQNPEVAASSENADVFHAILGSRRVHDADAVASTTRKFFERTAGAAGGATKEAAQESAADEEARFGSLYKEYMQMPWNKNRVKRTGWTKQIDGYKVAACGSSWADLGLITICFLTLYVCVGLFFWGLLEFYMSTDTNFEALYVYAGVFLVAIMSLFGLVAKGHADRAKEAAADAEDAEKA